MSISEGVGYSTPSQEPTNSRGKPNQTWRENPYKDGNISIHTLTTRAKNTGWVADNTYMYMYIVRGGNIWLNRYTKQTAVKDGQRESLVAEEL